MDKILYVATVDQHIKSFHYPYLHWFKENGYEVHVASNGEEKLRYVDQKYNVPFERSPFTLKNLEAYRKLKKIIDENDYKIIHCHTPVGGAIGRLASISARKKGSKVFYTAHGFHFYKGAFFVNWLIYYPIEKFLSYYTDVLITINKEDYKRAKKFNAKKIIYVPGVGLDVSKFRDIVIDKTQKRKEIGIPENSFVLLSVGELNRNKNHEVIIKAVSKLNNPHIYYIICGRGPLEDYLKKKISELKLENQIKLLGFRDDINEILKAADVFVFPSYREGLPVSIMEAMASGLPVICSNIRGNTDLIKDGEGGYLVAPNDINGFAEKINFIYSNKTARENMSLVNVSKVIGYDIKTVLEDLKNSLT